MDSHDIAEPRRRDRSFLRGLALGVIPLVLMAVAEFRLVRCPVGPMVYGYCSGSEQGAVPTLLVLAAGTYVLAIVATIVCLVVRKWREIGRGLLIMVCLFPLLTCFGLYLSIAVRAVHLTR